MTNRTFHIAAAVSSLVLLAAIAAGTAYAGFVVKKNKLIDEQTAEEFAILDAGVESEDITELVTKLEYNKGKYVYNITFDINDVEYDYKIRASDGVIVSRETDTPESAAENTANNTDQIDQSYEKAESIAETKEETIADTEDNTEETIAETDKKPQEPDPAAETVPESRHTNYISVDQAKKTALDHAGLTENDVKFSTAKLDNEDGKMQYEIQFYMDNTEYEFEIDAVTGIILDVDAEYDD